MCKIRTHYQMVRVEGRWKDLIPEGSSTCWWHPGFSPTRGWNLWDRTLLVGGLQFSSSADDYLTFISLLPLQQTHQRHMVCQAEQLTLLETQEHKRLHQGPSARV